MNFINNLFGTIAQSNIITNKIDSRIGFIPANNQGETIQIKGETAVWLGLKSPLMQKYAYEYCFPVSSVIDKLAEYDLTGNLLCVKAFGNKHGDTAESPFASKILERLQNPNPLQSWEQFRGQQIVYKKTYGFCPVLPIVPSGMSPEYCTSIINLPPWLFEAVGTGNIIYESDISGIVKEYKVTLLGKTIKLTSEQVFILEDSFIQSEDSNFLLPQSRLVGLDMAVSNICAAMEADNVLLKKKGPLGFISHDAAAVKDSVAGYLPMTPKEKAELQNDLTSYGLTLSQFQYVISKVAVKWNPISFNVNELGTKDTVSAGERAVCHRFAYPYVLYEESVSTYAPGDNAAATVYQTNIVPNANKDINKYNKFFKCVDNKVKLIIDFSEVGALQEDEQMKASAGYSFDQSLQIQYTNGIITKNQWLVARGYDRMVDGDVYFGEDKVEPELTNETDGQGESGKDTEKKA